MNKADIERAIEDVQRLQALFGKSSGYSTEYGDTAIAFLQAELARPEPEPVAWLIESTCIGTTTNWWNGLPQGCGQSFTTNPNKAARFCRQEDAEAVSRNMHMTKVTEHMWINGSCQKSTMPKEQKPVGMFQEYEEGRFEQMDESFDGVLLYATPQEARAGWQPIETAPKDGTRILIVDDEGKFYVAGYIAQFEDETVFVRHAKDGDVFKKVQTDFGYWDMDGCPAYWMLLPAAPKA